MKHTITDKIDVNVNLDPEVPVDDLKEVIDKVTEAGLTLIAALTVSHILRSLFSR